MKNITKELKRIKFIDNAFDFIEKNYITKQFSDACMVNETLNEFYELEESTQIGTQLTAQLSHSFYSFLKYHANSFLERSDSYLRVVTAREKIVKNKVSYDLILKDTLTGELHYIEIKLSQNKNSWQGSTSSTSKVDTFLLINFEINRDKKLSMTDNTKLFTGVFASIVNMKDKVWSGKAGKNTHRTKFDFRLNEWSIDILKENNIIKGDLVPKKAIAHLKLETIDYGNN
jgi:hypothetical protein